MIYLKKFEELNETFKIDDELPTHVINVLKS